MTQETLVHEQSGALGHRRTRAEAFQLAAEFEASGLSRAEFCRRHRMSLATLARYRKREKSHAEASGANRWLRVELADAGQAAGGGSGVVLVVSAGRRIEVARGFDPPTLEQLLRVLKRV